VSIDFALDDEGIALITMNRPDKLNAMDAEHYQGLSDAWVRVRDDPAVRCAIITGAGGTRLQRRRRYPVLDRAGG